MKINGWFRPLRREFWSVIPNWKNIHHFMSTQALALGTACLTVFIAVGYPKWVLLTTLGLTAAMVLYGSLVEQPEVHDDKTP